MPTATHAQQPEEHEPPPPPGRRDHETPAAGHQANDMTPDRRALRDMWLSEMWPVCHEDSYRPRRKPPRTAA